VTEEGRFDPLFVDALAAFLGWRFAHFQTGKASITQLAEQAFRQAWTAATSVDGLESGTPPSVDADDIIAARFA
jgi:hypothetical protein